MKNKKILAIVAVGIVFVFVLVNLSKKDLWDVNADLLKEKVLSRWDEPSREEIDIWYNLKR